jgi:apolipoprotein N-acyltransferase
VAALLGISLGYGLHRRWQTPRMLTAGPMVLVVQPNFPQTNSGAKGASQQEMIDFHVNATASAIQKYGGIDLACWSETMMPPLNEEYRTALHENHFVHENPDGGAPINAAEESDRWLGQVTQLASRDQVNIITGGLFHAALDKKNYVFQDRRNSAFLIRPSGRLDLAHYDKIHLVPFGEYMPFRDSAWLGWLHNLLMRLSPYDYDYTLTTPGSLENPAVFRLNIRGNPTTRILTPICFEDIDASLCAALMRGPGGKRADLLVNLTNDGWFKAGENAQHLQAGLFRSIENRVPIARSVNTGISTFIDSYGRVTDTVAVRTEGVAVQQVMLDSRYTLYTRVGDLFAWLCTLITLLLIGFGLVDRWGGRHP